MLNGRQVLTQVSATGLAVLQDVGKLPSVTDLSRSTRGLVAGENGETTTVTFAELSVQVAAMAEGLSGSGIGQGDVVAIYMPMVPAAKGG